MSVHTKSQEKDQPKLIKKRLCRVLFVCLGNICRSPAAEIIFNTAVCQHGLKENILADSCGTASYHTGQKPDDRMLAALQRAGFRYGGHRARTFSLADFQRFDLIIPQDESNRNNLTTLARNETDRMRIIPMSHWFPKEAPYREVPDPYYGNASDFDVVVRLLQQSMLPLLSFIQADILA